MPRGCSRSFSAATTDRQQAIHALRQRLHDEVVAVTIDDERREQIGFAVNQAVRRRVDGERLRGTRCADSMRRRISASSAGFSPCVSIRSAICDALL